jgi:hypothetical protein
MTVVDEAGNIYTSGTVNGTGVNADFVVAKYDPFGALVWRQIHNGLGNGQDIAMDLVYRDGFVYQVGRVTQPTNWYADSDLSLIKYRSSDGVMIWSRTYTGNFTPGLESSIDEARGVAVDSAGGIIVTGHTWQWEYYFPNGDFRTLKFDSSGTLVWDKSYHGGATYIAISDQAYLVEVDQDDNVIISGDSPSPNNASSWATIKYRGSDGQQMWLARSADIPGMSGVPSSLHISQDGDPIVIGHTFNDFTGVIRYDKDTGVPVWTWNQRPGHLGLRGAGQIDTNDDVVLGLTWDPDFDDSNLNNNTRVIRLNGATGTEMWRRDYGNSVYRDYQSVLCLNIRPDGRILVVGHGPNSAMLSRMLIQQYSPSGTQEWVYTHNIDPLQFQSRQVNFDLFNSMVVGGHTTDLSVVKFNNLQEISIPIEMTAIQGFHMAGGLMDIVSSDNQQAMFMGDELESGPAVEVHFKGTGMLPIGLSYRFESRSGRSDLAIVMRLKNWNTGLFETVASFPSSLTDVVHQGTIADFTRFVHPSSQSVVAQAICVPMADSSTIDGWGLFVDQFTIIFHH